MMLRVLRASLMLVLCGFAGVLAIPARADGIPPLLPPAFTVNGSLSIVGSNACGGPCTETIAFSFDLGYQFLAPGSFFPYVTNLVATGSGALGSFTQTSTGPSFFGADMNFFPFFASGAEIDIHINDINPSAPIVPVFINEGDLYSCPNTACLVDFAPDLVPFGAPQFGIFLSGPANFTVTHIPEPGALTLLAFGSLVLVAGKLLSSNR